MINFLSSWVKNLALALIVVSILEMILPNNKTKKYVKMVMGLYILFSIISPFIENSTEFNFNNFNLISYVDETQTIADFDKEVDQTSMDIRLSQMYKEELEKDIVKKINENGYEVESCKVVAHISDNNSEIEKITLKITGKMSESAENKIVAEIQEVNIAISGNIEKEEKATNITKADIKIIKDLLISEYGVNENCLKIS